ncbi:MAG: glycosyltransferase [Planctomycetota bacterium]|jgi:cellulose synthase/poly-beta-1,6-N-acetylglucosamine synthase-like glycosyltransferase
MLITNPLTMIGWAAAIGYCLSMALLALYALHSLWLLLIFARNQRSLRQIEADENARDIDSSQLPHVLVQLPVFNERDVVSRIVEAAAALDWPRDRLHIQLLDDSTDDSVTLGQAAIANLVERGFDAVALHRTDRTGFKAGALEAGMAVCDAPFIAIFDADFIPKPDFLLRAIRPLLVDDGLALVQGRWGHLNRNDNALTRAQAIGIDGHFAIEQSARASGGLPMNFNGTCGLWRRQAIIDGGGWEHETLTEDLDLSYRVQLAGWRCTYRIGLDVPGELPADIGAWFSQQFRWAKGSQQCARKLLPRVWRSSMSFHAKIAATLHTTHYAVHPLMLLSLLCAPWALWLCPTPPLPLLLLGLTAFVLGVGAPIACYISSQIALHGRGAWATLRDLPALSAIGTGIAISNTQAVIEAWRGVVSPFVRTPKQGSGSGSYRAQGRSGLLELLAASWAMIGIGLAINGGRPWVVPLLVLYASGFAWAGARFAGPWLRERWRSGRSGDQRSLSASLSALALVSIAGYVLLATSGAQWQERPLLFAGIGLGIGGCYLIACLLVRRHRGGSRALLILALGAVAMRLACLGLPPSDDCNRYVVEGRQMAYGVNPYAVAPAAAETKALLDERLDPAILNAVNHPTWSAIYPPLTLTTHLLISHADARPATMRLFYAGCELATMALILLLLVRLGLPPTAAVLALWNPVGPLWAAGAGHNDALMALVLVAGVVFAAGGQRQRSVITMSLAALCKPFAALALLPVLRGASWRLWLLPPCLAMLAYLPFADAGWGLFSSLGRFGGEMHFHGALESLLRPLWSSMLPFETVRSATVASLSLILVASSVVILKPAITDSRDLVRRCGRLLFALLLCLPTLHPWYFLPLVALLPFMHRSPAAILWTAAAPAYWLHALAMSDQGGSWQEDSTITLLANAPAFLAVAWHLWPQSWRPWQDRSEPLLIQGTEQASCRGD